MSDFRNKVDPKALPCLFLNQEYNILETEGILRVLPSLYCREERGAFKFVL